MSIGVILPLLVLPANAANINNVSPTDEAKSTSYYRTLRTCINNEMNTTIQLTAGDNGVANPSKWFRENDAYGYVFPSGKMYCKDIAPDALELWGWGGNYSTFLRELGFTYNASDAKWTVANRDNLRNKFDSAVQQKYYGINFAGDPVQSGAARYEMFLNVFAKACNAQDLGAVSSITNSSYKAWLNESTADKGTRVSGKTANVPGTKTDSYVYFSKVDVIEPVDGKAMKVPHGYAYQSADAVGNSSWGSNDQVKIYGYHNSAVERSCHEIQKGITENASAWLAWARAQPVEPVPPLVNEDGTTPVSEETTTSCIPEGVGWIVCPVVTFFAFMTDSLYNWISNYLILQPLNVDTSSGSNTMYIAWSAMRSFANVAFVIAFLIIIFSQLTGAGVSNYGVKKLLPRLVVAAILVNVSFWIAAIAVDISNIIGNNLYDILRNRIPVGDIIIEANAWETLAGVLLSGSALTAGVIGGAAVASAGTLGAIGPVALYAFIVFLLGIVLALIIAFIILALRQALIIILIVVSPLAFVAMLLPNTEKLYVTWRKTLTTLLIFYPLFSLLFGGSYLAGMIIIGSASSAGNDSAVGMTVLIGMVVTILPLWLTPLIARFSTGILSQVAGIVNNKGKGLIDRTRKVRDRKGQLAMHETFGSSNASKNPFSKVYRRMQNSTRTDSDRNKVIDSNNQSGYLTGKAGTEMSYKTGLASQKVEAADSYNKAYFEESKSSSQAIPADHTLATEIQQARDTQQELDINHSRTNSAKTVLQQELAKELSSRPGMAARAGGIDLRGQSRVVASANALIADAESKAISAEKSTMIRSDFAELDTILKDTSNNISPERRAAAAGQIMKIGKDSQIHATLDYLQTLKEPTGNLDPVTGNPIMKTTDDGIMMQQQVAADIGNRRPISLGAGDMTALSQGTYQGDFQSKVVGRIQAGKLSAETLHSATADELEQYIRTIPTMPAGDAELVELKKAIADYRASPTYSAPTSEILKKINSIDSLIT